MNIHPTAIIHPGAELAPDVEVQPYTIIEDQVVIGGGSVIGPHCVIGGGTVMGRNNRTYSGAQIGVVPQDLKHVKGALGRTVIGDNNVFREAVTVSSSTVYAGDDGHKVTQIGGDCLFMACSHVAHDCHVGDRVIMANGTALAGHVTVQSGATLGGMVGVHQFCVVGAMAFIGGMSRINMDVLPYMIMEGHPARCYGPNVVGLTRSGFSKESIARIRRIFKLIYRSGLNMTQAIEEIEKVVEDSPEKKTIMDFVRNSKRGVSR
ncbi:MAG: acyl-ACP--UDP-N-acetylglucosamine O-acyltransferase [Candidatus Hydrogenedens sp.]|nr:acyl-ACP--UDP-N-acetylglucosamine O-acyltransferase [Candidatus Hydrogenedens sp.]